MKVFEYSNQAKRLRTCRDNGDGFAQTLRALDEESGYRKSLMFYKAANYSGIQTVNIPYLSMYREFPPELVPAFFRLVICDYLSRLIDRDTPAIIEIGCGTGEILVSLARDHLNRETRFIATDISSDSFDCVEVLCDIAHVDNVEMATIDLTAPTFPIIGNPTGTIIYMTNTFSGCAEGEVINFIRSIPRGARLCVFEPLNNQLSTDLVGYVPVELNPYNKIGKNGAIWTEIKAAVAEGIIKVERLIPDFVGRSPIYSLSLIQMQRV